MFDTLAVRQDTTVIDTLQAVEKEPTTAEIDAPIDYEADDSLIFDLENDKVYLYGNGFVTYQDIELRAAYIELDRARDVVFARGTLDSLGKEIVVMHPGPINRGVEISSDAADSDHSIILQQVENGVAVRMAILYLLAAKR